MILELCIVMGIIMCLCVYFFCVKQRTAYEMRISDWSSDVCSSDLTPAGSGTPYDSGRQRPDDADEALVGGGRHPLPPPLHGKSRYSHARRGKDRKSVA